MPTRHHDLFPDPPAPDEPRGTDAPRTPDGGRVYDLARSRANRDLGIGQVSSNAARWIERCLIMIAGLPAGWTGISEEFQRLMGDDQPHDPHAWGAATKAAVMGGLLVKTGRWLPMRKVSSNARQSPEYRRT